MSPLITSISANARTLALVCAGVVQERTLMAFDVARDSIQLGLKMNSEEVSATINAHTKTMECTSFLSRLLYFYLR